MRYLFQGDSITDAGRANYEDPHSMGSGYPRLLEADLTFGQNCEVMNCGISGSRVVDLLARWKKDCLNLKPDVLTIFIGVNDVWHELGGRCNGVSPELFEDVYRILLREAQKALPGIRNGKSLRERSGYAGKSPESLRKNFGWSTWICRRYLTRRRRICLRATGLWTGFIPPRQGIG